MESSSNSIIKILKGSAISMITTLILLIIFSVLLTFTNINERTMPTVIIMITALSILLGSQITTLKIKKKYDISSNKKYGKRPLNVKKPIFPQYISFIINYILEIKHFQVQKQCFFIFTTKKFNNFCRLAIV